MNSKILLSLLLFCVTVFCASATDNNMMINLNSGTTKNVLVSDLSKVTLANGSVILNYTNGSLESQPISSITNITFGSNTSVNTISPDSNTSLYVYPNPAESYVTVKGFTGTAMITICTTQGTLVKSLSIEAGNSIDVSDLSTGFYILNVNNKASKFSKL